MLSYREDADADEVEGFTLPGFYRVVDRRMG